jgi:biopolymer transport protein ExbD
MRAIWCSLLGLVIGAAGGAGAVWLSLPKPVENRPGGPPEGVREPPRVVDGKLDLRFPDALLKPAEGSQLSVIVLNVNEEGALQILDREPIRGDEEILAFIKREARTAKDKEPEVPIRVVLRVHPEARFKEFVKVQDLCHKAGINDVKLRLSKEPEK